MTQIAPPHSVTVQGAYEPFDLQVARGQIMGHRSFCQFGINSNVAQSSETVWIGSSAYSFPASASVIKVSSSSADDTSAGTGAHTVSIEGVDANYAPISETVTLNGQTAVETTNSYLRINKILVLTAGSGNASAGTIYAGTGTVTSGVPEVVVNQTGSASNESESAFYTVPAGYTAYIYRYTVSSGNSTANAYTTFQLKVRPFGGVFGTKSYLITAGSALFECEAAFPNPFPEKCDIDVRAFTSAGTAVVSTQLQIVLIKNNSQTA
jgi:hypothetical protein